MLILIEVYIYVIDCQEQNSNTDFPSHLHYVLEINSVEEQKQ